jgi:uncharacterized protein YbaR (Trm112 family)
MEGASEPDPRSRRRDHRERVIIGAMRVDEVEALPLERLAKAPYLGGVSARALRAAQQGTGPAERAQPLRERAGVEKGELGLDSGGDERRRVIEDHRRRARPAVAVHEKEDSHAGRGYRPPYTWTERMAVDPELLAILVCPKTKGPLELVELKEETRRKLIEKYREKFRDEEPVVTQGLYSKQADLVYPIVSDIPVMLIDEALPGSEAR